jgi:hypothetical protein
MLPSIAVNVVLLAMFALYLWPRRKAGGLQRLFIATFGALAGSLVGRVAGSSAMTHLAFTVGGALLFSVLDWEQKPDHSMSSTR